VIVVAGHEQHFAISPEGGAQLSEHGLGAAERATQRPVTHLENIAQQDESVYAIKPVQQRRSLRIPPQHIDAAEPAQVQV
jgi:hypothetical protein